MNRGTLACLRWPPLPVILHETKVTREATSRACGVNGALVELCEAEGRAAHGGIPEEEEAGAGAHGGMEEGEVQKEEHGPDHASQDGVASYRKS